MLKDKKILILGASGAIGSEIAKVLYKEGANLILHGRDESKLKKLFRIEEYERVDFLICDLTENKLENLRNLIFPLDGIVFCAGQVDYMPVRFVDFEQATKTFNINYFSIIKINY